MTEISTPQIPDELRPYLETIAGRLLSGHAAVMVGSGFSKNAASPGSRPGFPDWSRLGDHFFDKLHGHPPGPNERYLQVPALAHQVEAAFGRPALDQMLRDSIPDLQHEPSPLHEALLNLPWSDVFTTNYDTLLERARRYVISQRYDVVLKPERPRTFQPTAHRQAAWQPAVRRSVHCHRRGLPPLSSRIRSLRERGPPSPPGEHSLSDRLLRRRPRTSSNGSAGSTTISGSAIRPRCTS